MKTAGPRGIARAGVLKPGERHWPIVWEHDPKVHACEHVSWELVLIHTIDGAGNQVVIRCIECHAPRCGHSTDRDPCMLVRHHPQGHLLLSQWVPDLTCRDDVERWLDS